VTRAFPPRPTRPRVPSTGYPIILICPTSCAAPQTAATASHPRGATTAAATTGACPPGTGPSGRTGSRCTRPAKGRGSTPNEGDGNDNFVSALFQRDRPVADPACIFRQAEPALPVHARSVRIGRKREMRPLLHEGTGRPKNRTGDCHRVFCNPP
jgi:hypothetical protein